MTILISDNGEFSKGLKFEARGSAHSLSHGPVYGSAGYLALRLAVNNITDTNVYLQSSTDGVNWIDQSHNMTIPFDYIRNIKYANGKYFIFGDNGTAGSTLYISHSTDMVNWTNWSDNTISAGSIADITYSNNLWLMIINEGFDSYIRSSTNLTTWTNRLTRSRPAADWSVAYEAFVTTGTNTVVVGWGYDQSPGVYVPFFAYSTNGTSWTTGILGPNGGASALNVRPLDVTYSGSTYVMVGTGGMIYTSTNMSTWTVRTSGTTADLYSVSYANSQFVAYGTNTLLTSTDGITWTSRTLPQVQIDDILSYSNGALVETKPVYANSKWIVGDWTSTNGTTWTILDFQLPNKQPFIKYPYESGWNTWKSMDFWAFIPSRPSTYTQFGIASEKGSWTVYIEASNSISRIRYNGPGFSAFPSATLATGTYGQWNHFRLVVDGGFASWYINGTRSSTTAINERTAGNDTLNIGYTAYLGENQYSRPVDCFLDEFLLTDEALNDPSATSITVPTTPWRNNDYTSILLHYDTNFEDDPDYPIRNAAASLASAFTQAAEANKLSSGVANITSNSSLTTSAVTTRNVAVSLSSQFTLSTSALDLDLALADLTVDSSLSASAGVIKQGQSAQESSSDITADNSRIRSVVAELEAFNAFLVVSGRTQAIGADIQVSTELLAQAVKTATANASLESNNTMSASAGKVVQLSSELTVNSTMNVVSDKVITFTSTEPTTSTMTTVAAKTARTSVSMLSSIVIDISTSNETRFVGSLFNSCSIECNPVVTRNAIGNFTSTSTMLPITNNVVRVSAALQVNAFELVLGRTINLNNSEIWIVPAENTAWKIGRDTNSWTVQSEDRTYIIQG